MRLKKNKEKMEKMHENNKEKRGGDHATGTRTRFFKNHRHAKRQNSTKRKMIGNNSGDIKDP